MAENKVSFYQKKYQIYPFIPETIKRIQYNVEKILPSLPRTAKKNNVIYKIKDLYNYWNSNLNYYKIIKDKLIKGANYYFKTIMDSRTNELYNPILVRLSTAIRDYERTFFDQKNKVIPSLEKASESGVQGIGIAPLVFIIPAVTAGASYMTNLLTKKNIVEVDMQKKIFDYDIQTVETSNKMKATKVPEKEIRAYILSRESMRPTVALTESDIREKKKGFIERILEKAIGKAMPMIAISGIAILGLFLFMRRRRR